MNKLPISKSLMKDSVHYDWWKCLLCVVALSGAWYFGYNLKHKLKRTEYIQIFSTAYVSDTSVHSDIEKLLKDDGILSVSIYTANEDDQYFPVVFETQGISNSDILLISEDFAKDNKDFFVSCQSLNDELKNNCVSINNDIQFMDYQEYTYGIKVFDKDDEAYSDSLGLNKWFTFEENYYLFLSRNSENLGKYCDNSKKEDNAAIKTLNYLLGSQNG